MGNKPSLVYTASVDLPGLHSERVSQCLNSYDVRTERAWETLGSTAEKFPTQLK